MTERCIIHKSDFSLSTVESRALLYLIKGDREEILHTSTPVSNVSFN